jgi:hypothetical protein
MPVLNAEKFKLGHYRASGSGLASEWPTIRELSHGGSTEHVECRHFYAPYTPM